MRNFRVLPLTAVLLAACVESPAGPEPRVDATDAPQLSATSRAKHATAELRDVNGEIVGTARFTQDGAGRLHLNVHVEGISPGPHGIHLHAVGMCDANATPSPFATAGGHFNPELKKHGFLNEGGHHAGDLPNLVVKDNGAGHLNVKVDYVGLADLLDDNGAALVLHAGPDDLMSDPAGNSGARIACGVLQGK